MTILSNAPYLVRRFGLFLVRCRRLLHQLCDSGTCLVQALAIQLRLSFRCRTPAGGTLGRRFKQCTCATTLLLQTFYMPM